MTYNAFIQDILETRGRFGIPEGEYKERHHIIPKCINGSDDEENLIDLYAKEHFIAHKLLAEENPDNLLLGYAFIMMGNTRKGYALTADEYNEIRITLGKISSRNIKGRSFYTDGNTVVFKKTCPTGYWKLDVSEKSRKNGSRGFKTLNEYLNEINYDEFREFSKFHTFDEIKDHYNLTKKMTGKLLNTLLIDKRNNGKLRSNKVAKEFNRVLNEFNHTELINDWNNGVKVNEIEVKYTEIYKTTKNIITKLRKKIKSKG